MIEITKAEAKEIRKVYPKVFIAKTRHKRFIEESVRYLELIPFILKLVKLSSVPNVAFETNL